MITYEKTSLAVHVVNEEAVSKQGTGIWCGRSTRLCSSALSHALRATVFNGFPWHCKRTLEREMLYRGKYSVV